jgi:hypothetical protein
VTDYSHLHDDLAARLTLVLADLSDVLTHPEKAEVLQFLEVREYGLALDTLSHILVDEQKAIGSDILSDLDHISEAMNLQDAPFMLALHDAFGDRLAAPPSR